MSDTEEEKRLDKHVQFTGEAISPKSFSDFIYQFEAECGICADHIFGREDNLPNQQAATRAEYG